MPNGVSKIMGHSCLKFCFDYDNEIQIKKQTSKQHLELEVHLLLIF